MFPVEVPVLRPFCGARGKGGGGAHLGISIGFRTGISLEAAGYEFGYESKFFVIRLRTSGMALDGNRTCM